MKKQPIVTYSLMAVCAAVFLLSRFTGLENETEAAILLGAYYKPFILAGQWWRLLTAGLIHTSVIHLCMNSLALYSIGRLLEPYIGHLRFLLVLSLSVLGGSCFQFASPDNVVLVGISGGLYGLLALELVIMYRNGAFGNPVIRNRIISMIVINVMISLIPNVSMRGHIGGFVVGLGFAGIYFAKGNMKRLYVLSLGLYFVILGFFMTRYLQIPETQWYIGSDIHVLQKYEEFGFRDSSLKLAERLSEIYQ